MVDGQSREPVSFLVFSASLREGSLNTRLAKSAAGVIVSNGGTVDFGSMAEFDCPSYNADVQRERGFPTGADELRRRLEASDAFVICSPEYNASMPGVLKNALDWVSRPLKTNALRNKPVAVVGASTGAFGAVWSQAELRKVLAAIGARVVEGDVAVGHAPSRFDESGRLTDDQTREQLAEVLLALVAEARPAESTASGDLAASA